MSESTWMEAGLADLQRRVKDASAKVDQLSQELAEATEMRDRSVLALQALQALEGGSNAPVPSAHAAGSAPQPGSSAATVPTAVGNNTTAGQRRRVKSVELVAAAVRSAAEPVTSDELYRLLDADGRIPTSWSKPRNAFATALSRAVERGLVEKSGDRYLPAETPGDIQSSGYLTTRPGGSDA